MTFLCRLNTLSRFRPMTPISHFISYDDKSITP